MEGSHAIQIVTVTIKAEKYNVACFDHWGFLTILKFILFYHIHTIMASLFVGLNYFLWYCSSVLTMQHKIFFHHISISNTTEGLVFNGVMEVLTCPAGVVGAMSP